MSDEKYTYIMPDKTGKWEARIYLGKGKLISLGVYSTREEAYQVRQDFIKNNKGRIPKDLKKKGKYRTRYNKYRALSLEQERRVLNGEEPMNLEERQQFLKEERAKRIAELKGEVKEIKPKGMTFEIGGSGGSSDSGVKKEEKQLTPEEIKRNLSNGVYHKEHKNILLIADLHAPYQHEDALDFIQAVVDHFDPTLTVMLGDEVDSHTLSFYPYHPDLANATAELKLGREVLQRLNKILDKTEVLSVESNHTSRVYRKGKSAGIPKDAILPYEQLLGVPWKWAKDWSIPMTDGTRLICSHHKGQNTRAAGQASGSNIAVGHYHKRGGIEWWTTHLNQEHFAISCPCLIDFDSPAYAYDENSVNRPNLGVTVILDGVPFTINMFVDENNRWTGGLWKRSRKS